MQITFDKELYPQYIENSSNSTTQLKMGKRCEQTRHQKGKVSKAALQHTPAVNGEEANSGKPHGQRATQQSQGLQCMGRRHCTLPLGSPGHTQAPWAQPLRRPPQGTPRVTADVHDRRPGLTCKSLRPIHPREHRRATGAQEMGSLSARMRWPAEAQYREAVAGGWHPRLRMPWSWARAERRPHGGQDW